MIYTAQAKIMYHDCDVRGRLKISAAMRYMQQISGEHLESLGFSAEKLLRENMVFLLSRTCLKIHCMPLATECISLSTAPTAVKGARFVREFSIGNAKGERLISAVTLWILIDPANRRILRPSSFPYELQLHPTFAGDYIEDIAILKPAISKPAQSRSIDVCYSHLDINNHVSNSIYADFICDILPYENLVEHGIDAISINFQNEARWGQTLIIERCDIDSTGAEHYICGNTQEGTACFESFVRLKSD